MRVPEDLGTEESCWVYFEAARWPEGVRCLKCGGDRITRLKIPASRLYQCKAPECRHQFSAIAGTILEGSHLPLRTWFLAIARTASAQRKVPAMEMQQELGVSYRTAWHLTHRIRGAMLA